jgi:hypothetical protein
MPPAADWRVQTTIWPRLSRQAPKSRIDGARHSGWAIRPVISQAGMRPPNPEWCVGRRGAFMNGGDVAPPHCSIRKHRTKHGAPAVGKGQNPRKRKAIAAKLRVAGAHAAVPGRQQRAKGRRHRRDVDDNGGKGDSSKATPWGAYVLPAILWANPRRLFRWRIRPGWRAPHIGKPQGSRLSFFSVASLRSTIIDGQPKIPELDSARLKIHVSRDDSQARSGVIASRNFQHLPFRFRITQFGRRRFVGSHQSPRLRS